MPRHGFFDELFARRQFLSQFTGFLRLALGIFFGFAFGLFSGLALGFFRSLPGFFGFPGFFSLTLGFHVGFSFAFGFRRRLALGLLSGFAARFFSRLAFGLSRRLTLGFFGGGLSGLTLGFDRRLRRLTSSAAV